MGIIVTLFILVGVLAVALIILLLVYLMRKNEWGKEKVGENREFDKSIRLIYMYSVTFVMFLACVGFAIYAINSLGYVFFPGSSGVSGGYKELIPAIVGVIITLPIFLYHFKQTKPKEER